MAPTGEMPGRLGSADSVTTTPFLAWVDTLGWTERSALLRSALREETAHIDRAMSRVVRSPSRLEEVAREFQAAATDHTKFAVWTVPSTKPVLWIRPNHLGGGGVTWGWMSEPSTQGIECGDLCWDAETGAVAYTVDASKGRESYTLKVTRADGQTWTYGRPVGSAVAIQGGRVIVQEEVRPLRTQRVVSLELATGRGRAILYHERDPETALTLIKGEHGAVFILGDRAGLHTLRFVRGRSTVQRLTSEGVSFVPIGQRRPGGDPVYLVRRGRIDAPWTAVGVSWRLGRIGRSVGIEFASAALGVAISKDAGLLQVWALNSRTEPRLLGSQFGAIFVNSLDLFVGGGEGAATTVACHAVQPGCNLQIGRISSRAFEVTAPEAYAQMEVGFARSKDGEAVRWILVKPWERTVRALLVVGYGAYGLPTVAETIRWRPWLQAGWAVAFALVRGGGDGSELWAFKGKMGGKERAIDDYEAVVRAVQARTRVGPAATCLFGRSAGGLLIGGAVARNPDGQLARQVYAEVPYVDLLKTASNPDLPLTPYEYHEFANPRAGPAEFAEALALSPVHRLGPTGAPGVRVLCRTALNDMQVYPYEALKWILRLRGGRAAPDGKYLRVKSGEGHFSRGLNVHVERAEDFLLVDSWV